MGVSGPQIQQMMQYMQYMQQAGQMANEAIQRIFLPASTKAMTLSPQYFAVQDELRAIEIPKLKQRLQEQLKRSSPNRGEGSK